MFLFLFVSFFLNLLLSSQPKASFRIARKSREALYRLMQIYQGKGEEGEGSEPPVEVKREGSEHTAP